MESLQIHSYMYIIGMILLVLRINNPQHCMVHCLQLTLSVWYV